MRYASVCSGIEAPGVAWRPLGWKATFFSEIENFPCRVLAARWPGVPNYGDMTKFERWPNHDGAAGIDVLIGGTPCQSFSISGLRKGLDDPRGNLMLTYAAIARHYSPRWLIWENVPGVLSSGGGRDFAAFQSALAECGYGWSWRVLDAQYVRVDGFERAVPQRRRRVFLVGHFGDARPAAEVLFEHKSLCGSAPPRASTGQAAARTLTRSIAERGWSGNIEAAAAGFAIPVPVFNVAGPLKRGYGRDGAGGNIEAAGAGQFIPCMPCNDKTDLVVSVQLSHTKSNGSGVNSGGAAYTHDSSGNAQGICGRELRVRRITPLECERLMGFPDGWTDIEGASDSARYKALGNSMAVNCIRWLGRRIEAWERQNRG